MTVACKHCPVILTAPEDQILDDKREARNKARLQSILGDHLTREHPEAAQGAIMLGSLLICWSMMTNFQSTDTRYAEWASQIRELIGDSLVLLKPEAGENGKGEKS